MLAVTAVPIMEESNDKDHDDEIIPFVVSVECSKFSMNDRLDHWQSLKELICDASDDFQVHLGLKYEVCNKKYQIYGAVLYLPVQICLCPGDIYNFSVYIGTIFDSIDISRDPYFAFIKPDSSDETGEPTLIVISLSEFCKIISADCSNHKISETELMKFNLNSLLQEALTEGKNYSVIYFGDTK